MSNPVIIKNGKTVTALKVFEILWQEQTNKSSITYNVILNRDSESLADQTFNSAQREGRTGNCFPKELSLSFAH